MASLDRIPEVGDEIEVSGHTLRVEQLDGRRAEAVRLLLAASPDGEEPAPHTASVGESDPGVGPTR